jgi:predicted AlkP superfamily phosphohydrolase/phosphomutase
VPVRRGRRVALLGLDSITPAMVGPMLAEGAMPALAELIGAGWSSEAVSTLPPTTPTAWTTVATGAWPSTHGVEGFAVHREGDPLDRKRHALTSDMVRADRIWDLAARHGLESTLLKFPVSWPPSESPCVTQVDGAGGWGGLKCVHDLVHSACWDSEPARATAGTEAVGQEWMTRDADNLDEESVRPIALLAPAEAGSWRNLPAGFEPAFGAVLRLAARNGGEAAVHALAGRDGRRPRLLLSDRPDAAGRRPVAEGEWTGWIALDVRGGGPDGAACGHVRFRAMRLGADPPRLRLYQSQLHRRDGFTRPPELARSLEAAAGPFVEWTEAYDRLQGWIDDATQLEIYRDHVEWMVRASRHLMRETPWRLFLTQLHVLDMAYHLYWAAIDPRHPDHRPEDRDRCWALLREVHALADRLVRAVREEADEETLVVVLGDHGHDVYHTALLTNHVLLREGLLAVRRDPRTGRPAIHWPGTAAYASGYRVHLNVRGRDPDGVLEPAAVGRVRESVIALLAGLRDPRTGQRPVRLALGRDDAAGLGLGGPGMGDVVFATGPGYQARSSVQPPVGCWIGSRLVPDRVPPFQPTRLFREFTGEHDTALPFSRSMHTLLYLAGPGVRRGRSRLPVRLVDVAPTLCEWLGLPPPANCEGAPIRSALA